MPDRRELTLYPYLIDRTCWVFDDERTGLKEEAFVLGASEMITRAVAHKQLPDDERGFKLTFSDEPFAAQDVELHWLRSEWGGNWYAGDVAGERLEAWLCPALFCYFQQAPQRILWRARSSRFFPERSQMPPSPRGRQEEKGKKRFVSSCQCFAGSPENRSLKWPAAGT